MKWKALRILLIDVIVVSAFFQCASLKHTPLIGSWFDNQKRVPGNAFVAERPGDHATTEDGMVSVHTPSSRFYIDPFETSELARGDFFSIRNQRPIVGVSADQAGAICASIGKRLCTVYEWTNACLGTHRNRYSYARDYNAEKCNTDGERVAATGLHNDCRTDTGIHDMIGNVMEWAADERSGLAVAIGGSYVTGEEADCFTRFYFPQNLEHEQIGFRCCRN